MPKKLLFLTWQANVHLAVIAELKRTHPDTEFHLSSAPDLAPRCPPGVTFHTVQYESLSQRFVHGSRGFLKHPELRYHVMFPTNFWGMIKSILNQSYIIFSSTPTQYLQQVSDNLAVIQTVDPDLVIVDTFDNASREAADKSGKKWVLLSPNTLKEVALAEQELQAFSYPFVGSGLPYPIPWYYLPLNVFYMLFAAIYIGFIDPATRALNKARHAAGFEGPPPLFGGKRTVPVICMSTPELEYPMKVPHDVFCCGPILQEPVSIEKTDPELHRWIMKRPTVLVLLGSHIRLDQRGADEFWKGAKSILDLREDVQLLWKLQPIGNVKVQGPEAYGDRVRIVSWFKPNPIDILDTGNIVAMVNHGGSNSYHEALASGTPQVIISPWYDCHDFGVKVEWLGVGKWANRHSAPEVEANEFGKALRAVVGEKIDSPEAGAIRARARACRRLVELHNGLKPGEVGPNGRELAAHKIYEMASA